MSAHPGACPAIEERRPVVAPSSPGCHAQRRGADEVVVEMVDGQPSDQLVIRVKGEATVRSAGLLLQGLMALAARRPGVVTLDLSELRFISSLSMGVLVAYRRGVVRSGGQVRLAETLQPAVREALIRAGVLEVFETHADAPPAPNRPHQQ
jgi:anti-anti-sigma factor